MAKNIPAGLIPTGFQRSVIGNNTAVGLNSTVGAVVGSVLRFSIETNGLRYRDDGTDPTTSTGVLLETGIVHIFEGYNGTSDLKFISDNAAGSVLQLTRYRYPGENPQAI